MADLSKMQVGTTVYNMKDVTARNSLTPATQTKMGLMSAEDKRHLDAALYQVEETAYFPDYVETQIRGYDGDGHSVTVKAATKTEAGVMSSADKKKLDGISSGVFIIDVGSEDNTTDDYTVFCADYNLRERLNAIDTTVPLFVRWFGIDGTAILPVSVSYDSNEVIYTIWGDPLSWWSQEGENGKIIAIEYYSGEFVIDGFTSYRKVFATKGSEIAI